MVRHFLICFCILFLAQDVSGSNTLPDYDSWQARYAHLKKNDPAALPWIRRSIATAKITGNARHLMLAYEDAIFYNAQRDIKQRYADSTIQAAQRLDSPDDLAKAFLGKGIIWYFNYRDFPKALQEYTTAYALITDSGNQYLRHKVAYHMGVVKNHLGLYDEALPLFTGAADYFNSHRNNPSDPNAAYNNTRGYLNTLHQLAIIYRSTGKALELQNILEIWEPLVKGSDAFSQERAYFLKEKGIQHYNQRAWHSAALMLQQAAAMLQNADDAASLGSVWYYQGRVAQAMHGTATAKAYFLKTDSLYTRLHLVTCEIRAGYEGLLAIPSLPRADILCYTHRLLEIDSIFKKDYPALVSRITAKYDQLNLIRENSQLEKDRLAGKQRTRYAVGLAILVIILLSFLFCRERLLSKRFSRCWNAYRHKEEQTGLQKQSKNSADERFSETIINEALAKLEKFEEKELFKKKDLTFSKMSDITDIRRQLLTYILKTKKVSYYRYLHGLRIRYMTRLMLQDRRYLAYTLDTLADLCGYQSRQVFAKQFREINGITAQEFIKRELARVNEQGHSAPVAEDGSRPPEIAQSKEL
ncbi:helix-turn-helix transcriptional regulator [Chryseobacterium sp. NEB161]|nr:helix-turn-helix transcriptional regulator [Chryseobacterium sp. NEB161]